MIIANWWLLMTKTMTFCRIFGMTIVTDWQGWRLDISSPVTLLISQFSVFRDVQTWNYVSSKLIKDLRIINDI